jgi:Electron transfer DM13
MNKKIWIGVGLAAAVLVIGWAVFRPELLFVNRTVSEGFPAAPRSAAAGSQTAQQLFSGQFEGYAHPTDGTASIYRMDGKRILRLTNFRTSNGPDVHVYMIAAPNATDDATVKNAPFVDLGIMKGNIGDQNYDVPDSVDLERYRAVVIWCKRFNVNFGTAPLAPTN